MLKMLSGAEMDMCLMDVRYVWSSHGLQEGEEVEEVIWVGGDLVDVVTDPRDINLKSQVYQVVDLGKI